jgi:hypothetical protein
MDSRMEVIQLELKYCERCGGLWLRRQGTAGVYCAACAGEMPEFPGLRKSKRIPRLPRTPGDLDIQGQLLVMFSREGGNA